MSVAALKPATGYWSKLYNVEMTGRFGGRPLEKVVRRF